MKYVDSESTIDLFCQQLYVDLDKQLGNVLRQQTDAIKMAERSILIANQILTNLRGYILIKGFTNQEEEIRFFKIWKPKFYGQLIYELKILQIETRRPSFTIEGQAAHLKHEQIIIQHFFEKNLAFYQYCRVGATYLDSQYFLRETIVNYIQLDQSFFNSDPRFSASQDEKMAKIVAYEMLQIYLSDAILKLRMPVNQSNVMDKKKGQTLSWTGSKIALIELIYALQSSGVFNDATAELCKIADFFESAFQIDLGNYYRIFQDIRIRKKSRTCFLDHLKQQLDRRMDDADQRPGKK